MMGMIWVGEKETKQKMKPKNHLEFVPQEPVEQLWTVPSAMALVRVAVRTKRGTEG